MKERIVSGFAAMGVAAAIIVPLSYGAQGRETRQSTDRAEARIAILKADLRLSADQVQH